MDTKITKEEAQAVVESAKARRRAASGNYKLDVFPDAIERHRMAEAHARAEAITHDPDAFVRIVNDCSKPIYKVDVDAAIAAQDAAETEKEASWRECILSLLMALGVFISFLGLALYIEVEAALVYALLLLVGFFMFLAGYYGLRWLEAKGDAA